MHAGRWVSGRNLSRATTAGGGIPAPTYAVRQAADANTWKPCTPHHRLSSVGYHAAQRHAEIAAQPWARYLTKQPSNTRPPNSDLGKLKWRFISHYVGTTVGSRNPP